jgi:beta-glucosidase
VAFPFGHGLSYTGFALGKPALTLDASGVWQASARVTNTGKRSGAEVVQVYLTLPQVADAVGAKQPPRRLVGYQRVELAAGASQVVSVPVNPDASNHPMGVWSESKHQWVIPEGRYTVWLGRSSSPADLAVAGVITR